MINPIGQFKSASGCHLWNRSAQKSDDLLVGMTVAIINNDPSAEGIPGPCLNLFFRRRNGGYLESRHVENVAVFLLYHKGRREKGARQS